MDIPRMSRSVRRITVLRKTRRVRWRPSRSSAERLEEEGFRVPFDCSRKVTRCVADAQARAGSSYALAAQEIQPETEGRLGSRPQRQRSPRLEKRTQGSQAQSPVPLLIRGRSPPSSTLSRRFVPTPGPRTGPGVCTLDRRHTLVRAHILLPQPTLQPQEDDEERTRSASSKAPASRLSSGGNLPINPMIWLPNTLAVSPG